ncbi:MAG: YidH family protein [Thainema sp.]
MSAQPPPQRPYSATNELAKERNRAAAERTLMAWIQSSVVLIGFGIATEHIYIAFSNVFPEQSSRFNQTVASVMGLSAIALGLFLLGLAVVEYPIQIRAIERNNYLSRSSRSSSQIIISAVILFGLLAIAAVLVNAALIQY